MCANEQPCGHQQKPGSLSSVVDKRAQERINNQRDRQNNRRLPCRLFIAKSISMLDNIATKTNQNNTR